MKKLLSICLLILLNLNVFSQEELQFKFYMAFEEGTGQRDTIWLILDESAHLNTYIDEIIIFDTILGEVPLQIDTNSFNVFYTNYYDTLKTFACPSNGLNIIIEAINYSYPVTVTWDTSIFFNNSLPLELKTAIILNSIIPADDYFNMLTATSVTFQYSEITYINAFPMTVLIDKEPVIISENINMKNEIKVYPNPFTSYFYIKNNNYSLLEVFISNANGKLIDYFRSNDKLIVINSNKLNRGIYFLKIINQMSIDYEKIIKY